MSRRSILLVLLGLVVVVGIWRLWSKWDVLSHGDAVAQIRQTFGLSDPYSISSQTSADGQAAQTIPSVVDEWADDKSKPPRVRPAPEFEVGRPDEMFPFAVDTPLLAKVVPLPKRRAPHIYMAHGQNSSDENTSASGWFNQFLKFQVRAQSTTKTLLNLTPNAVMLRTISRAFVPVPRSATYQQYLADARAEGADFLILPIADGEPDAPRLRVKMVDLRNGKTEEWQPSGTAVNSVHDAIVQAAVAVMKFAGLDDKTIADSGVRDGAPSDKTFRQFALINPQDYTWETIQAVLQNDPDCRCLYSYDYGTTSRLQLVNAGLTRFPEDARLQLAKGYSLADNGSTTALVRYASELMRRYPGDFYVYVEFPDRLQKVFTSSSPPRETPSVFKVMLEQMDNVSQFYPDFYSLSWDRAYMHKVLAGYVRGWRTVDRIPSGAWAVYRDEINKAYELMAEVAKKNPNNAAVLRAFTYFMTSGGGASQRELRNHIKKVAAIDPRATDAETEAAFWQGVGYGRGNDYIRFIDEALDHHKGDPQAIKEITKAVGMELSRQVGWKQMTEEEAYGTTNPYVSSFLAGAEFVYANDMSLDLEYDKVYAYIAQTRGQKALMDEWQRMGQNSYVALGKAKMELGEGDWEQCLRMAKAALPHLANGDLGHLCRYYIIKSLWKLKRYEESLKAARDGIMTFPYEQTFPYMYAVVGLEYGKDLETAFDCAWRAVDLGTDNSGCNETFEKLRAKLGKPQHPDLIALKSGN